MNVKFLGIIIFIFKNLPTVGIAGAMPIGQYSRNKGELLTQGTGNPFITSLGVLADRRNRTAFETYEC